MGFTGLDYFILFAYLAATLLFGTLIGRGQKDIGDYFLGARRMPWWAICGSIVATETSTLTFIGAPAIAYGGNMTFLQVAMGYVLGKVLVSVFLIPAYFRGEIETAYQLLQSRFGAQARHFAAAVFQITRLLADGVRLFATALVLGVITGMSDIWTVMIIGVITIIYTFYGGIRSVVWNDVIQLGIYLAGAMLAFFLILERIPGGWATVVQTGAEAGKFRIFDFAAVLANPYTFWGGLVGGAFLTFATHGTDQMMVQRYLACGRKRDSQWALVASGFVVLGQFLLFLLIGVMLYAFYQHFPLSRPLSKDDEIFPLFIVEQMPPGVSGLVIAAIFAAAMSTLSSSLNSLASSSVNDFYRNFLKRDASPAHYLAASRVMTLLWGVLLVGVSTLPRNWGGVLEVGLTITSITMGSMLGIFLLGIWTRRTSQGAALAGMISGLVAMSVVWKSAAIAWTWYTLVGTMVTFAAALLWQKFLPVFARDRSLD